MTPTSTVNNHSKRIALFAGSFNPFTAGHADIVARGLALFDHIVVAVGVNATKTESANSSVEVIAALYSEEPRVEVCSYTGLTAELAKKIGACAILRGVRSVQDFEYERNMADINRQLTGIETVLLTARPELGAVSSSIVRELRNLGVDVSSFMP